LCETIIVDMLYKKGYLDEIHWIFKFNIHHVVVVSVEQHHAQCDLGQRIKKRKHHFLRDSCPTRAPPKRISKTRIRSKMRNQLRRWRQSMISTSSVVLWHPISCNTKYIVALCRTRACIQAISSRTQIQG
jgi:hypothetical protein